MKYEGLDLVLLIDDDKADNFFHERAIRKSGYNGQIDICTSGDDALDYLFNKGRYSSRGDDFPSPGLIFLDINMPRVDGWQFLEKYETLVAQSQTECFSLIMMLSTANDPVTLARVKSIPIIREFIVKPLRPEIFDTLVSSHFLTGPQL